MVNPEWGVELNSGSRGEGGGQASSVFALTSNALSRTGHTHENVVGHVVEGWRWRSGYIRLYPEASYPQQDTTTVKTRERGVEVSV
jgi:hypothetical protein